MVASSMRESRRLWRAAKSHERVRDRKQCAKQRRPPKGVRVLGYEISGATNPTEAEAVRGIFQAFHRGAILGSIAKALSGNDVDNLGLPHLPRHTCTLALERNARRQRQASCW